MFPLHMFGSREENGKGKKKKQQQIVHFLSVWFGKKKGKFSKKVFFYFYTLIKWRRE